MKVNGYMQLDNYNQFSRLQLKFKGYALNQIRSEVSREGYGKGRHGNDPITIITTFSFSLM